MSTPRTADQERARLAFTHVSGLAGTDLAADYRSICLKLPVLVHQEGLTVALHFVAARDKPGQKVVLDHLAAQLGDASRGSLLARVREAETTSLQALTRDVQRCLSWYKRFCQAELTDLEESPS